MMDEQEAYDLHVWDQVREGLESRHVKRKVVTYTFADIEAAFVVKASKYCAYRYRHYGVEFDDVKQELLLWLYAHTGEVDRWLANEPQQTTRIYRTLLDQGIRYGEGEKASRLGYDPDDITWYTPNMIEAVMPLALDDEYTGGLGGQRAPGSHHGRKAPQEGGDLLAVVIDVRRAIERTGLRDYFMDNDSLSDGWRENVRAVIDQLGGEGPRVGRRRAMTNAQAQAITRSQDDE